MSNKLNGNLSKTKPKLRTEGAVTGNFGAARRRGGSVLTDIPSNSRESLGNFPTRDEYANRLRAALASGVTGDLQKFILAELAKHTQASRETRVDTKPQGPFCNLQDHFVTRAQ